MPGRVLLALVCAATLGAGCGIKGPLTLPQQAKSAPAPSATPAGNATGAGTEGADTRPAERKP